MIIKFEAEIQYMSNEYKLVTERAIVTLDNDVDESGNFRLRAVEPPPTPQKEQADASKNTL